jgi:lipase maturation factor 1
VNDPLRPAPAGVQLWLSGVYPGASGPAVAALFHRLFALLTISAWGSLALQITTLIGERGLLPLRPLLASLPPGESPPLLSYPSLLRWPSLATDGVLVGGAWLGVALGLLALFRVVPRLCFLASTLLYLSYASACRGFLSFQWDNLLLEVGLLAALLPAHRPAPLVHLLLRVTIFKLYFQSGLAKWQSPEGDWLDGSAMRFYYETAPLPTALGFFAHQLPAVWHKLESWVVLWGELLLPFAMFAGRRPRLTAAVILSGFQFMNLASANYGFFCYLALALHVFLFDDPQVERAQAALRGRLLARLPPRLSRRLRLHPDGDPVRAPTSMFALSPERLPSGLWRTLAVIGLIVHLGISVIESLERFAPPGRWQASLLPVSRLYSPLRLVSSYHLFASVTRERIEPQIELKLAGMWTAQDLRYKPGHPTRRPPFVAPHQPRVDFLLWFHGLDWRRPPAYLQALLERLCHEPDIVAPLFARPLPQRPQAARVVYQRYHFATLQAWRREGVYWQRVFEGTGPELSCDR